MFIFNISYVPQQGALDQLIKLNISINQLFVMK
jgi:hypothetical protein